jgi:hypothetical protein
MTNRYRGTELLGTAVIVLAMTMISALPSRAFFNYDFWIGQDFRTTIYSAGTYGQAEISGESGDANSPEHGLLVPSSMSYAGAGYRRRAAKAERVPK